MRSFFCLLLAGLPAYTFAQVVPDALQQKAEQSLHREALVPDGTAPPAFSITERMQAQKVNGISIAVIDQGRIAWAKGYGIADASDPAVAVDTTTLFQCASIGKVVTTLAVLHLVKTGKISLDQPVNKSLAGWKIPASGGKEEKVTLRNLLSHTAGLDDEYGFEGYIPHSELPDILQMLDSKSPANTKKKLVVKRDPGTLEKYSGGGFLILQKLIGDLSGQSFPRYVDSLIFKPLKMQHSTYDYYPDENSHLAIARGHDEDGKIDKKRKYMVYPEMAAAGFWTTASDLALLVLELQREDKGLSAQIADSSLIHEMLRPQINTTGLGIHMKGYKDVAAFWHSGNNAGYTGLLFGTREGQGAVVLTNSDNGIWLAQEVVRSIADTYQWPAMQTEYLKETSGAAYDRFTGGYSKDKEVQATVGKDGKGLFLQTAGNKNHLVLYESRDGSFLIKEKPEHFRLFFEKEATGKVKGLRYFQQCGTAQGSMQKLD